jgi:hypothetical protein
MGRAVALAAYFKGSIHMDRQGKFLKILNIQQRYTVGPSTQNSYKLILKLKIFE